MTTSWASLDPDPWAATRADLHHRARVVGAVPRALLEPHPHWWHLALQPHERGLTTLPMEGDAGPFSIVLDLDRHVAAVGGPDPQEVPLGQAAPAFVGQIAEALAPHTTIDIEFPEGPQDTGYRADVMERFAAALRAIVAAFESFAGRCPEETSPVQLWPHHLDLALTWFSGRTVPDTDPADPESHRESATVGFSPGDDAVPDPYFYGIAYPFPSGATGAPLPDGGRWIEDHYRGAFLPYASAVESARPAAAVQEFLTGFHDAVAPLMR